MSTDRAAELAHQKKLVTRLNWRCCVNCDYFAQATFEGPMVCRFDNVNIQPPMEVIVVGCEQHVDHIPF